MSEITKTNCPEAAHTHSSQHRQNVLASEDCGCFYCQKTFPPTEVKEWTDSGQTALCPHCGIDSVVGSNDVELSAELLAAMHERWFEAETTVTA